MLLVALAGCKTGKIPDPNDPADVGVMPPQVVDANLRQASDFLNERKARGEINDWQYRQMIVAKADELLDGIDLDKINGENAWEYGRIFMTGRHWKAAKAVLQQAVAHATEVKNEDRRVNDTIRLAASESHLGEVEEAIKTARASFTAADKDAAPILPGVMYEVVPPGLGQGQDAALASLLVDAASQHKRVVVDASKDAGKLFLMARPFLLRRAYGMAGRLYFGLGMKDKAMEMQKALDEIPVPAKPVHP